MGYTHNWTYDHNTIPSEAFAKAVSDLNHILPYVETAMGDKLYGGNGTGPPEISASIMNFNGNAAKEEDHENFYINPWDMENGFNFCKTARKPYDLAVCVALIILAKHVPGLLVSSDGGDMEENWPAARQLCRKHLGILRKDVPNVRLESTAALDKAWKARCKRVQKAMEG